MTADDIPFAQRLKEQNRWNQVEADWQRQLDLEPGGCFVAERAGLPVGTACCCVFDQIAWINFVLVDLQHRGQGIGSLLLRHVLQYLDERGIPAIRLDATPLGQPVYEKLGFVGEFALTRFEGIACISEEPALGVSRMTPDDLLAVGRLDETVTGTHRIRLLRHLYEADPDAMRKFAPDGDLQGYCLSRPGAHARQLGPIQGSPTAGRALLLDAAQRFAGQCVYLDVPTDHIEAMTLAQALGLCVQRSFVRMGRGKRIVEDLDRFWTSFGPEKG